MDNPIVADGLCIRPFVESDAGAFVSALHESVATVGAWMPWCTADYSITQALAWFDLCHANLRAGHAYDVGVFASDGADVLGGIAINQLNRKHNFGNIGYWVRQSRQRRGVATRAVRTIAAYGFNDLRLTRLEIVAAVDNRASRGVAEKVGAVFECIARNRLVVRGEARAAAVYSLTPRDLPPPHP